MIASAHSTNPSNSTSQSKRLSFDSSAYKVESILQDPASLLHLGRSLGVAENRLYFDFMIHQVLDDSIHVNGQFPYISQTEFLLFIGLVVTFEELEDRESADGIHNLILDAVHVVEVSLNVTHFINQQVQESGLLRESISFGCDRVSLWSWNKNEI